MNGSIAADAQKAAAPVITLSSGTYRSPQQAATTDATSGATIYYAVNATPTTASSIYTAPITVSTSEIIDALACAPGHSPSQGVSAFYTIDTTSSVLTAAGADPYNMMCSLTGSATAGRPGPTGTMTFTDTTTGTTLSTVPLGAPATATIYSRPSLLKMVTPIAPSPPPNTRSSRCARDPLAG